MGKKRKNFKEDLPMEHVVRRMHLMGAIRSVGTEFQLS